MVSRARPRPNAPLAGSGRRTRTRSGRSPRGAPRPRRRSPSTRNCRSRPPATSSSGCASSCAACRRSTGSWWWRPARWTTRGRWRGARPLAPRSRPSSMRSAPRPPGRPAGKTQDGRVHLGVGGVESGKGVVVSCKALFICAHSQRVAPSRLHPPVAPRAPPPERRSRRAQVRQAHHLSSLLLSHYSTQNRIQVLSHRRDGVYGRSS